MISQEKVATSFAKAIKDKRSISLFDACNFVMKDLNCADSELPEVRKAIVSAAQQSYDYRVVKGGNL